MICILLFFCCADLYVLVMSFSWLLSYQSHSKEKKLYKNENGDIALSPSTYDDRESFVSASKKGDIQPCEATGGG